ncbi:nucleotidyltransferase [Streptomyces bauhiniae]|uniref:Nucleotidyltransferase n=1 Tax=Streptomyces bauhiniae TaxID=2340725 RepID=A0A7K3QYC0_9ACTN|nr:nucleotidyltransferase [Streptomyces bauhiniae]NEB94816.1 nucleotidyltransferase [Streptomyces bauhiniae]
MPTEALLTRFLEDLAPFRPLAVWAHGSLGGGDYQEGRSDLDLIAVLPGPLTPASLRRLIVLHRHLRAEPLADRLHCSYLTPPTAAGPARPHLTWAHGRIMRRPVTPVTRSELHEFGRVLHGAPPAAYLPPVPDRELRDFVAADQRDFWRPAVDKERLWTEDIWVDLGLLTFARATVTLREGRLISKRQALAELPALGAPREVVEDVTRRRYGEQGPGPDPDRRARLTRAYLGPAIDALVAGRR